MVTPIMLIKLGKLIPAPDLLAVQLKTSSKLIPLELMFMLCCAKIQNTGEWLVWLGLEQCVKLTGPDTMPESMKSEEMRWKLLR